MAGAFEFAKHSKELLDFTAAAKSTYPSVSSWGTFGLCWGGKVRLSKSPIPNSSFQTPVMKESWGELFSWRV
jgi:hypothetical protein